MIWCFNQPLSTAKISVLQLLLFWDESHSRSVELNMGIYTLSTSALIWRFVCVWFFENQRGVTVKNHTWDFDTDMEVKPQLNRYDMYVPGKIIQFLREWDSGTKTKPVSLRYVSFVVWLEFSKIPIPNL